ncbi:MAG: ATP-dependent DNA helicase RecG [Chthonomonadales bacterium]
MRGSIPNAVPVGIKKEHSHASTARSLGDDIQYVKGVGPAAAQLLAKLGIRTARDVLRHIPRRYEDRTNFRKIRDLIPGEPAVISAKVVSVETTTARRTGMEITRVTVDDGTGRAQLVFFRQPYLQKRFAALARSGTPISVYGFAKLDLYHGVEIERAEWEELGAGDNLSANRIVPIYPATEGIRQARIRRIVYNVLQSHGHLVPDAIPGGLRAEQGLPPAYEAIRNIHFPSSTEALSRARRALVFEEFLVLQAGLIRRRAMYAKEGGGLVFTVDWERLEADLRRILPFQLTGAQRRAISEIAADVSSGRAMNRLVQGDVGSGKTVVALAAALMAVENGYQVALMAPTEILAQQHAFVLRGYLEPLSISVALATGSQKAGSRRMTRDRVAGGESPVVVGTHALIQEDFQFHRLGLVIIDEQHRFGVLQRQALHKKGRTPHVLVMTATPIPRTLTLTLYGDLDTSIINELPPGRKPIKTYWKPKHEAASVYAGVRTLLEKGRQAYVVCPLVEESEKLQARAAVQLAEHIRKDVLPGFRVGLLHGQLPPAEKDEVMRRFKAHELDILVATTVIEVGIDVPNACVMVIEDADRFGLAQLHQLRGRVGRGEHSSYCLLLSDAPTEDARARMQVMVDTCDGFRIAEEDLRLRGPGEFFGTRQSGLPELYIGDLVRDFAVMEEARRAAMRIVAEDPNLEQPEHAGLRAALQASGREFELVHVS